MLQKVCIDEKNQNRILHYNLQWFAKDGEGGEKTEPATAKKLKDARDEGKVAKSRELNSAFDLIVLFLCLKIFVSFVGGKFIDIFSYIYENMPDFVKINEGGLSVQAAAGLMHPNVVNVYDVGEEDGIYYIVMELVEGITLKKYIETVSYTHLTLPTNSRV